MDVYGILVVTLILIILVTKTKAGSKNLQLPPGPNGVPLLGNLLSIRTRTHESLANLSKIYGPLMTLNLGFINVVVVSSAEMSMEVLQKHDVHFSGRPIPDAVTAEYGHHLSMPWLPAADHQWRKLRRIFSGHISAPQKLDSQQGLRRQVMQGMAERVGGGGAVDVGEVVFGAVVQMISKSVFSDENIDPRSEMREAIARIMVLIGRPNVGDYFPWLKGFDLQGIRWEIKKSYDRLHELIQEMMDRRVKQGRVSGDEKEDILDALLHLKGADSLSPLDIKLLITEMFIGGTDSTTTTVEWAMAELLRNPAAHSKLKQELNRIFKPGKPVQEKDITQLPYLTAVIKETLRLHPISPLLLPHRAEQQVQIRGYTIPKGTRIWITFWSISRDPACWDEPTSFVPERFLNSEVNFHGRDFSFTPFGAGRRICPGLNLAIRMVSLLLATLVHGFDWKLPTDEAMDMRDEFGVTLKIAHPLVLIPIKCSPGLQNHEIRESTHI